MISFVYCSHNSKEVAWKISTGDYNGNVPSDIVSKINQMHLGSPQEFTAYPEGCPMHPSWPAMHSAASSVSLWLAVVGNLTEAQWHEAKLTDYAVSFARSVAGVHYEDDNIAGLHLAQEIVARELPSFLATRYGADPMKVREKVQRMRFDWGEFHDSMKARGSSTRKMLRNAASSNGRKK